MNLKTFSTVITGRRTDAEVISAVSSLAERAVGHLDVLALGIEQIDIGSYHGALNVAAVQQTLTHAREEGVMAKRIAESTLRGAAHSWSVHAMVSQMGALTPTVADNVQFSDLVVLPKPYGAGCGVEDVAILEAALFATHVPLLVLPEPVPAKLEFGRIVIGWNMSEEALGATRAALPLLQKAKMVDILIIDPPAHGPDRSDPGGRLAEMLSRKGIRASISVVAKTMPSISDVIGRHVSDKRADLLVMGAYGHSILREAILGGATRDMLQKADIPVFMAR